VRDNGETYVMGNSFVINWNVIGVGVNAVVRYLIEY